MFLFAVQQVSPVPSISFIIRVVCRVDTSVKAAVDVAVNEPPAPKVEEAAPEPVKEDPPLVAVTEKDPFEDMKPGCTKVATPLPELIPECVKAVRAEAEPEDSDAPPADTPLVDLAPASPTPASPTPASPAPASTVPLSPVPVSAVTEITVKTEPEPEPEPVPSPKPRSDFH